MAQDWGDAKVTGDDPWSGMMRVKRDVTDFYPCKLIFIW